LLTALITGANGFCAKWLIERLACEGGITIIGLDLQPDHDPKTPIDDYFRVDVSDYDVLSDVVRHARPDLAFNLAGLTFGHPASIYRTNVLGCVNLLEAVKEHAPEAKVLTVGSAAEYGLVAAENMPITEEQPCRPFGAYGLSKYSATLIAMDYARREKMRVAVVRLFNIVGAGVPPALVVGALIQRAKKALENGETSITVGNLDTQRDFVAVEDVVEGYFRLMQSENWGEVFNICSGAPISVRSIAEMLLANSPTPINLVVDQDLVRPSDVPIVYGSWEKANRAFGFRPSTDIEDALKFAWEFAEIGVPGCA